MFISHWRIGLPPPPKKKRKKKGKGVAKLEIINHNLTIQSSISCSKLKRF